MDSLVVKRWLSRVKWRRPLPPPPEGYVLYEVTADKARFYERAGLEEYAHYNVCAYVTVRPNRPDYHPHGLLTLAETWLSSHGEAAMVVLFGGGREERSSRGSDADKLARGGYLNVRYGYERLRDAMFQLGAPLPFDPKAMYQVAAFLDAAAYLAGGQRRRPPVETKPEGLNNRMDFGAVR
jgi:hypothetical protein